MGFFPYKSITGWAIAIVDNARYVRKCLRITPPPCHNGTVHPLSPRRKHRHLGATLGTALLLLTLSAVPMRASATRAPQIIAANGQGALLFVGDSLTVGSDAFGALATRTRNTGIWTRVTIDARVGRTARAGATTVASKITKHTTAVVIALGTNDMLSKPESWYPAWVIDKVMNETQGRPVLWFNLEYSATSRPDWRSRAARFNRSLKLAQERWPQLVVADWNKHFVPNKVSRFIADGVHLTVAGYRTRATFTLRQMELFGQTIVDSTTTTTTIATTTTTTHTSTTTTTTSSTSTSTSSTTSTTTTTTVPAPTTT